MPRQFPGTDSFPTNITYDDLDPPIAPDGDNISDMGELIANRTFYLAKLHHRYQGRTVRADDMGNESSGGPVKWFSTTSTTYVTVLTLPMSATTIVSSDEKFLLSVQFYRRLLGTVNAIVRGVIKINGVDTEMTPMMRLNAGTARRSNTLFAFHQHGTPGEVVSEVRLEAKLEAASGGPLEFRGNAAMRLVSLRSTT